MKTIEYYRGKGEEGFDAVDRKNIARYMPKRVWKQKVRDAS
jgi:hypothetical protein